MTLALAGEWPATIAPRVALLDESIAHRWTCALDGEDARLAVLDGALWVARAGGRLLELGLDAPAAGAPGAVLPPGGFRPGYGSDPVYVTDAGEVGRWSAASGWRPSWSSGLGGRALDAFGLPGGKVILSSSEWPEGLRLLDERRSSLVWSLATIAPRMLAVEGLAVGWRAGRLEAIDLAAGRVLWSREGALGVAAMSEAAVWLMDESEGLIEVAAGTGAIARAARPPGGVPSFALAPGGVLYAVGRPLDVLVLDLLDGMRRVVRRGYPDVAVGGAPRAVAPAAGGRLVVVDAHAVLELRPERSDAVREVWRTDDLIVEAEAAGGSIAVVTVGDAGGRSLTLLGPY